MSETKRPWTLPPLPEFNPVNPHDLTRDEEKAWALGLHQYTTSTHIAMDARKTLESHAEELYEALAGLVEVMEAAFVPQHLRKRMTLAVQTAQVTLARARGEQK